MRYEWDKSKAVSNARKHGVRFANAVVALEDDSALTLEDDSAEGERRFVTIGMDDTFRILVVVWTERKGDVVRIISARKATANERKAYER
ncbi:MAG: BrnT family toxin [Mariprofundaceae bacterium]